MYPLVHYILVVNLCSVYMNAGRGDIEMLQMLLRVMRKQGGIASSPEARALSFAAAECRTKVVCLCVYDLW